MTKRIDVFSETTSLKTAVKILKLMNKQFIGDKVDNWHYKPEYNEDGSEKHVFKEGARYHVISYYGGPNGGYRKCSQPNCEMNQGKP